MKAQSFFISLLLTAALAACSTPTAAPTATPAATITEQPALPPTPTQLLPTKTPLPTNTSSPKASPRASISRLPAPASWIQTDRNHVPTYDPNNRTDIWQVDLRTADLRNVDLRQSLDALMHGMFDTMTQWPPQDMLPAGFETQKIMDLGSNPGLGIRQLHAQGITGKGVSIAIIDQVLLVDHPEYADQLRQYAETEDVGSQDEATMHAGGVASIAVGKTAGVAPEANLYYIGSSFCWDGKQIDYSCLANAIRQVLEINHQLPEDQKIRVITTETGWGPDSKGYAELTQAIKEVKDAGIFLVSSSIEETHGFKFQGLGRDPLADPDLFESYEPGFWWAHNFYNNPLQFSNMLLVPMDARTTAGPHGASDYVFYRFGGWSWSEPWIAGLYALAVQANQQITPDAFWSTALKTGVTIQLEHNGEKIPFGPIVNPVELIKAIKQ